MGACASALRETKRSGRGEGERAAAGGAGLLASFFAGLDGWLLGLRVELIAGRKVFWATPRAVAQGSNPALSNLTSHLIDL